MSPIGRKAALPLLVLTLLTGLALLLLSGANGFLHRIDPVMLRLGSLEFRYYGLVYFFGFLTIYLVLVRKRASGELAFRHDQAEVLVMFGILCMMAGARLFEILFYNPGYYLANPLETFKLWEGGLSFHGALAGVAFACWRFTRNKPVEFLALTDVLVFPIVLFLALGRGANFVNGELYGIITDLPWGVKFAGVDGFRHPTQLYEALKNLYIFAILYYVRARKPAPGTLSFLFLILYGGLRFLVEFLKNYRQYTYRTLETPFLNIAQILCLLMIAAGILGFRLRKKRHAEKGSQNA